MIDVNRLEPLLEVLRARVGEVARLLSFAFGPLAERSPEEELKKFGEALEEAELLLTFRHDLEALHQATVIGGEARVRFVRAMQARGMMTDN